MRRYRRLIAPARCLLSLHAGAPSLQSLDRVHHPASLQAQLLHVAAPAGAAELAVKLESMGKKAEALEAVSRSFNDDGWSAQLDSA